MSYRTNRLGEQVSDSYEPDNDKYIIDVEYDYDNVGTTSSEHDFQREQSSKHYKDAESVEEQEDEEATTPILRPWTKTNFRKVATSDVHKEYEPTQYMSGSDFSHTSVDKSPISLSSEDNDELPNLQSAEPMTPSRLLTLNSFDFMDASPDDVGGFSHANSQDHSGDSLGGSLGHNQDSRSVSSSGDNPSQPARNSTTKPNPAMSPITLTPKEINITDEDMKKELTIHGDIVTEYATQLTLSLKDHMAEVMLKLTGQKETELRGRDSFYTKELQKQQIIIEDLEEVVATYEKNLLHEEGNVEKYRTLVNSVSVQLRERYVSPFSMFRLLQNWHMFTLERKRMARLHQMATKHHKKIMQRAVFDEFKRESNILRAERRGVEEKKSFDRTVRDLVSRYERQIATLTADLQESQESLAQEKARRQQLEEDLRRMFLKNMTVMNMEALSLFQTPVVAPPQLAEFGPDKKLACEMQEVEATQKRQEGMLSHMRMQQQQLQSQQHEYKVTVHPNPAGIHILHTQPKANRSVQPRRDRDRDRDKSINKQSAYTVERGGAQPGAVPRFNQKSNSQNHSHSHSHSHSSEWDEEEEEEALPRVSPHPLPYRDTAASARGGYRGGHR